MTHSIKIDVNTVIAEHNANSPDGSLLVLLPPSAVEFVEKIASDNGAPGAHAAAVGSILAQAAMYHEGYEANMIERFIAEGRVNPPVDEDEECNCPNCSGGDITEQLAGKYSNLAGLAGLSIGGMVIEADSLPEALEKMKAKFAGMTGATASEPAEVVKARETLARYEANKSNR